MIDTSRWSRRVACAVGVFFCTLFATASWASVIYEYREFGSSDVIGTLEIAQPPASRTSPWFTVDPADLIALKLANSVFGLGPGNLLPGATILSAAILSLDGAQLDVGAIDINFPPIIPGNPADPTIEHFLSLLFGVPPGADFVGLSTLRSFPGGALAFDQSFVFGDWTAAPEPSIAALVVMGLAAAGRAARRKRR